MRTTEQLLEAIANELVRANGTLEHIRSDIADMRAALGTTSRSSVEVAQTSKGVNLTVKSYADSPVQDAGDAAIAEFGRLYRLAEENMLNGWKETLDALRESRNGTPA